jgi:ankyrin repeat protein
LNLQQKLNKLSSQKLQGVMAALSKLATCANGNHDGDFEALIQNALAHPSIENVGALVILHKHNIINLNKAAMREFPRSSNKTGSHPINALELYCEQAHGSDLADDVLIQATHSGVINQLKQAGISVQGSKNSPNTPLHMALSSAHHNPGLAKALLQCGADPFAKGSQGVSALRFAAQTGQDELLPIMLATKGPSQWPVEVFDAALASDSEVLFRKIADSSSFKANLPKHIAKHGVSGIGPNGFSFITTTKDAKSYGHFLPYIHGDNPSRKKDHCGYSYSYSSSLLECALLHAIKKDDDQTLHLLKSHSLQTDDFEKIVTFKKTNSTGEEREETRADISNPKDEFFGRIIAQCIQYDAVKSLKLLLEKETHDGNSFQVELLRPERHLMNACFRPNERKIAEMLINHIHQNSPTVATQTADILSSAEKVFEFFVYGKVNTIVGDPVQYDQRLQTGIRVKNGVDTAVFGPMGLAAEHAPALMVPLLVPTLIGAYMTFPISSASIYLKARAYRDYVVGQLKQPQAHQAEASSLG